MAPLVRRRTKAMLVLAGLLLVAVVGLAWFLVPEDDPAGGTSAGGPVTIADPAAGPAGSEPATTAGPATTRSPATSGERAGGGTGTDTFGPPAPPACQQVLSSAEAAAALGAPVARTEARDGSLVRACTFWASGDGYLLVQVSRGVAASRDQFELSRLPGDRAVAGIGQAARWTRDTGLLDVLDGPARFQVGLFTPAGGTDAAEPPARLEAVARAIAARL